MAAASLLCSFHPSHLQCLQKSSSTCQQISCHSPCLCLSRFHNIKGFSISIRSTKVYSVGRRGLQFSRFIVRMAPDPEKVTKRNPLDFPFEWERPRPGRRPDIFPQFSPMKTPLPTPMPADPPFEVDPDQEEEEEEKKEEEEEQPQEEEQPDQPEE